MSSATLGSPQSLWLGGEVGTGWSTVGCPPSLPRLGEADAPSLLPVR